MKKILSILLSIAMLVTMVSTMAISASAEVQTDVIYNMSEGSRPADYTVTAKGQEYMSFVDSEEEGYGDVLKALRTGNKGNTQDQAFCIKLPTNIWTAHDVPETLTFDVKADTGSIAINNYIYLSSSATSATTTGYASPSVSTIGTTWKTVTIDLTTATAQNAISKGYLYLCMRNSWAGSGNDCNYIYIDNVTLDYEMYPEQRLEQAAPAAPTVASATSTTVTLTPNSNCQFSMNGTDWQNSNEFTGLTASTQYTFYARYKETMEYYASPASEGTVYTTPIVYKWNLSSTNFTLSDTNCGNFNSQYNGEGTYFVGVSPSANSTTTFTSKFTVPAGVYSTTLYARKAGNRASINVDVNDVRVASALNTGLNGGTQNLNQSFPMTEDTITITEESTITMTITTTNANGGLYLNALQLEKIGDYVAPVVDPYENIAGTTNVAAQLRIGNVNGIRFITEVDADLVAQAKAEGYTVTMGTLIAPLASGELTLDTDPVLDIPTAGWFANNVGEIAGSIVSIKSANITKDFVARGYVTLTKDEVSTTYYASQPNEGRSLKTVAAACVADNSFFSMLNDAQKEQVTTWATWANA